LGGLADQVRAAIRVDPQRAVVREAGVDLLGQFVELGV
jgi:hypothetical protein